MDVIPSGLVLWNALIAVILALPLSWLVLLLYGRNLRQGMRGLSSATAGTELVLRSDAVRANRSSRGVRATPSAMKWRLVVVYALAALVASGTAVAFQALLPQAPRVRGLGQALVLVHATAWPLVPTLITVLSSSRAGASWVVVSYLMTGVVIALALVIQAKVPVVHGATIIKSLRADFSVVAMMATPPGLVLALLQQRRIRAASAFVLIALLVFAFATLAFLQALAAALGVSFDEITERGQQLSMLPVFLLLALPIGLVCWMTARWLVHAHRTRRFSDVQLSADAFWVIALMATSALLMPRTGWRGLWLLIVAFIGYRAAVALGLWLCPITSCDERPLDLLFLRVFHATAHAERLFDAIVPDWRFRGSVQLIGGPDLARRTADISEVLALLSGELRDTYVRSQADLDRRLAESPSGRDPDGRFRVHKLVCFEDTWQRAFEALLDRTDLVLMDLRGFTPANRGCVFELETILARGKAAHTLVVVDDAEGALRAALSESGLGEDALAALQMIRIRGNSSRTLRRVYTSLSELRPLTRHAAAART